MKPRRVIPSLCLRCDSRPARVGAIKGGVRLFPISAAGKDLLPVTIPVTGEVLSAIGTSVDTIDCGVLKLGEAPVEEFELFSRDGRALTIKDTSVGSSFVTISQVPSEGDLATRKHFESP